MQPSLEDRLSYAERQIDRLEEAIDVNATLTRQHIHGLEQADMIILGCLVCLTILAWYAMRKTDA